MGKNKNKSNPAVPPPPPPPPLPVEEKPEGTLQTQAEPKRAKLVSREEFVAYQSEIKGLLQALLAKSTEVPAAVPIQSKEPVAVASTVTCFVSIHIPTLFLEWFIT